MIILHNSLDKESRDFLTTTLNSLGTTVGVFVSGVATSVDNKHTVYDWYQGGREAFWATGNTHEVSAFPSVIVDIPTHRIPPVAARGGAPAIPGRIEFRRQHALRKPANLADVEASLNKINIRLAKSALEGKTVTPLTINTASVRKR